MEDSLEMLVEDQQNEELGMSDADMSPKRRMTKIDDFKLNEETAKIEETLENVEDLSVSINDEIELQSITSHDVNPQVH